MNDDSLSTVTQMMEGPVPPADRVYAFDRVRDLCRTAPRVIRSARTRLTAQPDSTDDCPAAAEGTLMLDGGLILSSEVMAATVREAIDVLMARFRHRLKRLEDTRRDQPIGSFPASAA
jgi:ribosome-associated translation inhibitor RaiA